jgi:uncharacterized membrane protein
VNIIDKYVLSKWIREPFVILIIVGIIGLIAAGGIYFLYGFQPLSNINVFLALSAGILHLVAYAFYFKALKIEEVSRVVPLFYLSPVFLLFLAAIFLGEIFTPLKYLGVILLVIGAMLISLKNFSTISFGKAFYWMICSALFLALNSILIKYLLRFTNYWTIFAWERVGNGIATIPIFYLYLSELLITVRKYGKKVISLLSVTEVINILALLLITIATSVGYVTLVNALASIQPFFVLIFTVILSVFYPSVLKEEVKRSIIFLKILAIILIFVGAILIT